LCLFFLNSCKKEKEPVPIITYASSNYTQLKTGNYWVYQVYDIDTLGNETPTADQDSCYIEKDTLINGKIYYEMHRPGAAVIDPITYLRDSLTYIVNEHGKILFSSTNFNSVFLTNYMVNPPSDTICKITEKMTDINLTVSTPAGNFTTLNYQTTTQIWPSWVMYYSTIAQNTRYAKDIGIVSETMPVFLGTITFKERRLINYHLN
jgi:hypothetical protein